MKMTQMASRSSSSFSISYFFRLEIYSSLDDHYFTKTKYASDHLYHAGLNTSIIVYTLRMVIPS